MELSPSYNNSADNGGGGVKNKSGLNSLVKFSLNCVIMATDANKFLALCQENTTNYCNMHGFSFV